MNRQIRARIHILAVIVFVLVGFGCGSSSAADPASDTETQAEPNSLSSSPPDGLPASFEGELPCADCPGIFYHLDLFEDQMFFLRTTYLGRGTGAVLDTVGSWEATDDQGRLTLFQFSPLDQ